MQKLIVGLETIYKNGKQTQIIKSFSPAKKHLYQVDTLTFEKDEYITRIDCSFDEAIEFLQIHTNKYHKLQAGLQIDR